MHATNVSDSVRLVNVVWGWSICAGCEFRPACPIGRCPAARFNRLRTYMGCFHSLAAAYEIGHSRDAEKSNLEDVFAVIGSLKNDICQSRQKVTTECFPLGRGANPSPRAQAVAVRLAVQALLMVDCSAPQASAGELESGDNTQAWSETQPLQDFIEKRLPRTDNPIFANTDANVVRESARVVTGAELSQRARLRFKGTNDISRHLHLDIRNRVVEIFHYTSFLKEYLLSTKDPLNPLAKLVGCPSCHNGC